MSDLARKLDAPIALLACPPRLRWVIEMRGIETIGDLVALAPEDVAQIRRCGKKTVDDTDRALRAVLGVSWREAHARTKSAAIATLDSPLASIDETGRLRWLVAARSLATVRDLAQLTPDDVLETRNCGPRTVAAVAAAIRAILGVEWDAARDMARGPTAPLEDDWERTLASLAEELDDESREILVRRLGVGRRAESVDQVARALLLAPRRARRVEQAALARLRADRRAGAARARLRAVLAGGAVPLAELGARDPYFAAAEPRLASLALFVDLVLRGPARTRRVGSETIVSTFEAGDLAWRVQRLREARRRSAGVALVDERVADRLGWSRALTRDLIAIASRVT